MSVQRLTIATRRSRLALWQAEHIKARLQALHPKLTLDLLPLSTRGDELIDRRLDEVGGKGLFVKELESAMAEGRADIAVHSMKDVPADLPSGFTIAAVTAREDPRDAFVSNRAGSLAELPKGAVLGTSSLRRGAQLRERHRGIEVRLLRGSCALPLGAYATIGDGGLELQALVASADGARIVRARAEGRDPEALGAAVAQSLREQGAEALLPPP